jgi:hypothetical protein
LFCETVSLFPAYAAQALMGYQAHTHSEKNNTVIGADKVSYSDLVSQLTVIHNDNLIVYTNEDASDEPQDS